MNEQPHTEAVVQSETPSSSDTETRYIELQAQYKETLSLLEAAKEHTQQKILEWEESLKIHTQKIAQLEGENHQLTQQNEELKAQIEGIRNNTSLNQGNESPEEIVPSNEVAQLDTASKEIEARQVKVPHICKLTCATVRNTISNEAIGSSVTRKH
jgi:hypothetical protein